MLVPKVDGGVVGAVPPMTRVSLINDHSHTDNKYKKTVIQNIVPLDVDNWYHRPSLMCFA